MPQRSRIRDRDLGYRRFVRNAVRVPEGSISVGVQPRDARRRYPGGPTVGQVANWHESGTATMPRRPFLSLWWARNRRRVEDDVVRTLRSNLSRGDALRRLRDLGREYERSVVQGFSRLRPLDPGTVRQKRSSRILIRSGLLARSISSRVAVRAGSLRGFASLAGARLGDLLRGRSR